MGSTSSQPPCSQALTLVLSRLDSETFSRSLVARLVEHLEGPFELSLTSHERVHLVALVQTLLEVRESSTSPALRPPPEANSVCPQVDEQQRALDINGLRYLISLRFYVVWGQRQTSASGTATPRSDGIHSSPPSGPPPAEDHQRISFRNVVWAFHSQTQEILVTSATAAAGNKMLWKDAKTLGVFLWLRSNEVLVSTAHQTPSFSQSDPLLLPLSSSHPQRSQMEVVARNHYMLGEDRDPTQCSLLYFALGKSKLVQGLWKQAAWHPEQRTMLKFLANDFNEPRWRTAALKNAFALLSKQRFGE